MARKLRFQINDQGFEFSITKVDRDKLYGKKELIATDHTDRSLQKGFLDEWGSVVIASTGMGYVDKDLCWHGKNELVAVDVMGNHLELKPSSFDEPVPLLDTVSLETYCEYEITSVYIMEGFDKETFIPMIDLPDQLYSFPFVYRATYDAKTAFLNVVGENLFMTIGTRAELEFLSKPQRTDLDLEEDDDDIDFSMM